MASSIFYKFKNSREHERITFDGTGITVFEVKKAIIALAGLGDGTDFDLHIFPEDQPTAEYIDDVEVIPRSSSVVVSRRPAARGHGRAARYVSGRPPIRAIKKTEPTQTQTQTAPLTEQDAEAAFLAESAQVWDQQKETLSHARPVFNKKKPVNVPAHDPPPGYVCYRCQKKGHWIQSCPTNNDPSFVPAARAKRTTGIPRSFLKTVEKPAEGDENARGVMLNSEGDYVKIMTDTRTWEKFQEKANASKAQAATAEAANKDLRERGLECPIDQRMFVDPVKTPCCGKTYCHDCIENALADGDLVCPNCSKDGVLIDDLVADEEKVEQIRSYTNEKAKEKLDLEQQSKEGNQATSNNDEKVSIPTPTDETAKASENNQSDSSKSPKPDIDIVSQSVKSPLTVAAKPDASASTPDVGGNGSDTDTSSTSKKRKAGPADIIAPKAPKAMRMQQEQQTRQQQDSSSAIEKNFIESMEALRHMPTQMPMMPMQMPMMPMQMPMMPMQMPTQMPMQMQMPMPMQMPMNQYGGWNGYNQNGYQNGYQQYGNQGGYAHNGYQNQAQGFQPNFHNQGNMMGMQGGGSEPEQNAYERQPVNPHRSKRKQRAPDFRYV